MEALKINELTLDFSEEYNIIIREEKKFKMNKEEKKLRTIFIPYINSPNGDIKDIESCFSHRLFKLSMNRAPVDPDAVTYQIRDSSTGSPIIRIDINKNHGRKIIGSHIHIEDPFNHENNKVLPLSELGIPEGEENPIRILKDILNYFNVCGFDYLREDNYTFV